MYFGHGTTKLQYALKSFRIQWEATEDGWRDQVRQDFEDRRVRPMLEQAVQTARAMDQLADLFARIQRDCS